MKTITSLERPVKLASFSPAAGQIRTIGTEGTSGSVASQRVEAPSHFKGGDRPCSRILADRGGDDLPDSRREPASNDWRPGQDAAHRDDRVVLRQCPVE